MKERFKIKDSKSSGITEKKFEVYEKLRIQLPSMYEEMQLLSKKTPNGPINKFKLNLINQILSQANEILDEANKPFDNFTIFDEDDLPSNSDVVMVLAQYIQCLNKYRIANSSKDGYDFYWVINGKVSLQHRSIDL